MSCFAGHSVHQAGRLEAADPFRSLLMRADDFAAVSATAGNRKGAAGLSLRMSAPNEFRIAVCCSEGRPLMEFGPYDDGEIVAVWRRLSETSGLPFVVAAEIVADASTVPATRPSIERRERLAIIAARRPRFLCRRKTGRLPRSPLVHRETEIVHGPAR